MKLPPVVHCTAKAITPREFLDALQATCVPRFPPVTGASPKPVGLAISGGVDSMALAFLMSKVKKASPSFVRVGDHFLSKPLCIIIDHRLREGSTKEAQKVAEALAGLGLTYNILPVSWGSVLGQKVNPNSLPNIETVARTERYRLLGARLVQNQIMTLLTAHHEDDQYETVLMRLLSGHGYRGLCGMRPYNDIPEAYGEHGVSKSGLVDDATRRVPVWPRWSVHKHEKKRVRQQLGDYVDPDVLAREIELGSKADILNTWVGEHDWPGKGRRDPPPPLTPMDIEDGGIMLYRPLLGFSKDRLIATCLENYVPWFEDHTNTDQTLTMRNAVRYMWKNRNLPVALQKPAVLRFSENCRARVAAEEAEADRLIKSILKIDNFDPNVGSLVVELPKFLLPSVPRITARSSLGKQKRIQHYRLIAALIIRRLITMVTPEHELGQMSKLDHIVSMLFPSLVLDEKPPPPKAYVVCGVHFIPLLQGSRIRWSLSRAPYVSNERPPPLSFQSPALIRRVGKRPQFWKWDKWSRFRYYDNRYWVRIQTRLPFMPILAPFRLDYQQKFREALDEPSQKNLAAILRRHAPGKIRYTLPAIYAPVDITRLIQDNEWWPSKEELEPYYQKFDASGRALGAQTGEEVVINRSQSENRDTRRDANLPEMNIPCITKQKNRDIPEFSTTDIESRQSHDPAVRRLRISLRELGVLSLWERGLAGHEPKQLLALPTLDIQLPGLENWIRWEFRYRKVDSDLLRLPLHASLSIAVLLQAFREQLGDIMYRGGSFAFIALTGLGLSYGQENDNATIDLSWYPPKQTHINNLTNAIEGEGVYGYIFNSSDTPDNLYGVYNWCNMAHVRKKEYVSPGKEYNLVYVEVIHRHHKRTPYSSNSFPVEPYPWNCDDQGLYYYGESFAADSHGSTPAYWKPFTSDTNPFSAPAAGWQGTCQFPQITSAGLSDSWQHGHDLEDVYRDILPPSWQENAIYRVTTNTITTQVAGAVIRGMLNTTTPKAVLVHNSQTDSLEPKYSCPRSRALFAGLQSNSSSPAWREHLRLATRLFDKLDSISGADPVDDKGFRKDIDHYYDNLSARQCHQKPLPCSLSDSTKCITQEMADAAYRLGNWEYSHIYRSSPHSLAASVASYGVFIAELASHFRKVMSGEMDNVTYWHNIAHDGSLSRLLSILQIEEMVWPGMGAEVVFEVYKLEQKKYFLRVLFSGKVLRSSNPTLGVMDMVPLERVLRYFEGLVGRHNASLLKEKCGL
ncbi:histidine phosphatase superfamily [Podospora australis]|uniref:tRNA(Ile)-lysidine synthetase n=1 Tax=Podospora australis TaxID=1536484 RepID=A0AAN7AHE3_9PEZI|nr:histidine phosphatase superfamily [Podospora australis]